MMETIFWTAVWPPALIDRGVGAELYGLVPWPPRPAFSWNTSPVRVFNHDRHLRLARASGESRRDEGDHQ